MISQDLSIIVLVMSIIGLTIACISAILAAFALIKVIAMEKSTHTIQYVDPEIEKANKEFLDEWATPDSALEEQDKLYKEDLEELMPEFATSKEDKEIYSF